MFYSLSGIVLFVVMIVLGHPGPITAQTVPPVVINELMWMGSSTSTADEWIELRNLSEQSLDISGWKLTKKSSGAEVSMLTIPPGATIAPNGYFLVANYAETNAGSVLAVAPNVIDTDVALVNTALQIKLYDDAQALVDTADDGSGNPLAGRAVSADQVFWSMERNGVPGDGTLPENWHTASRGIGFDDSRPERGTPSSANSNGLPIAAAGPNLSGVVGESVNFDGSESIDPEQQPLTYSWDFGDGATSQGVAPNHAYTAAGEFTAILTVSDAIDTVTDSAIVTISPAPAAAPTDSASSPAAPIPSPQTKTFCRGLHLNEVFPNPAGVDEGEFIELFNPTKTEIALSGCSIWLNDKRRYILPVSVLGSKQLVVVEKSVSKLSLTNTGGTLRLADTDGVTLETLTYPKAPENESWSDVKNQWSWTNRPTPGASNLEPVDDDSPEVGSTKPDENVPVQSVSLTDLQTLESGQAVKIQGTVTVAADILANRTIWLQDDTAGGQVLLAEEALRPAVGDLIQLTGSVRSFQGRKRLSVKAGDIQILASGRAMEPKQITLDQVSVELADQLVSVEGLISNSSGSKITIDDGSAESDVYLKSSTGIVKPKMAIGDRLAVIGIISATTAGLRIMPRVTSDLHVARILGATTSVQAPSVPLKTSPPSQTWWYWGLVFLGGTLAMVKPAWRWWQARRTAATTE